MIAASELKRGMVIQKEGHFFQIVLSDFHQGGGKMGGAQHVRLKNLSTGAVREERFRPDERLEQVEVDRQQLQFLYQDGDLYVFMNPETFDQVPLHKDYLGDKLPYLKDELQVTGLFFERRPLSLEFPEFVDLRVVTSPPPVHDQETTTAKEVTLENGMEILAPPFIKEGDLVRVNTDTGKYMERV